MTPDEPGEGHVVRVVNRILDALVSGFLFLIRTLRGSGAPVVEAVEATGQKKRRRVIAAVSGFLILGSLFSLCLTQCEPTIKVDLKPHQLVGEVVAQEVVALLPDKGRIAIIRLNDEALNKVPEGDEVRTLMKGFHVGLGRHEKITLEGVEELGFQDYLDLLARKGFPTETYLALVQKHPGVDAIVSFVGPPVSFTESGARPEPTSPKLIVFSRQGGVARALFEDDLLLLAIIPKTDLKPWEFKPTGLPRDEFDRRYRIVTKETAFSLPY